jgi:hypothetical protein
VFSPRARRDARRRSCAGDPSAARAPRPPAGRPRRTRHERRRWRHSPRLGPSRSAGQSGARGRGHRCRRSRAQRRRVAAPEAPRAVSPGEGGPSQRAPRHPIRHVQRLVGQLPAELPAGRFGREPVGEPLLHGLRHHLVDRAGPVHREPDHRHRPRAVQASKRSQKDGAAQVLDGRSAHAIVAAVGGPRPREFRHKALSGARLLCQTLLRRDVLTHVSAPPQLFGAYVDRELARGLPEITHQRCAGAPRKASPLRRAELLQPSRTFRPSGARTVVGCGGNAVPLSQYRPRS